MKRIYNKLKKQTKQQQKQKKETKKKQRKQTVKRFKIGPWATVLWSLFFKKQNWEE